MLSAPGFRFAVLAAVLGCGPGGAARQASVIWRDDLDQPVSLTAPARRIVSLAPATTELLFTIGAGELLVGRTRWCDFPPDAAEVPSVGDGLTPNVEVVAARRPDLVVMYASASNLAPVEQLRRLGIPAVNLRLDALGDVARAARVLARLTGRSARGDSVAAAFEAALDSAAGARSAGGPRTAAITWIDPPNVIGRGSFLDEVIRLAGGRNVFDDVAQPSATVSIESIAARDPDVILALGGTETPDFAGRPEWQVVRAVRERRFIPIPGSEFSRPSVRAIGAVHTLRAAFAAGRP